MLSGTTRPSVDEIAAELKWGSASHHERLFVNGHALLKVPAHWHGRECFVMCDQHDWDAAMLSPLDRTGLYAEMRSEAAKKFAR